MVQTLTPHKFSKKEQEQNQIYFDFIKDAIDNYEVKNFAITGAYGTGKSTIIQNFFRLYPTETEDYTHAIVSLSSFCATSTPSAKEDKEPKKEETFLPKEENKEREENKTKESRASSSTSSHKPSLAELEMSILQQLFYQIDEKKLRFSRFQRKTKISTSNKIFTFIVSLGCVITLFAFSYKDTFSKYLSSISQLFILEKEDTVLFNIIKGIGLFIPALILTIGAYILFEKLYYGIYKGHWKKLQFNLGKIQSEHQITGSIINDNLHDILVFFHNAELDVVVFEDIDRLDNAMEIFTKLRELNETINRSHEFQSIKKKVLFIYALKDDILPTPEARTKFFDLIMPIVPLVSSDNSYNLFSQELKEIAKKYPQKDFIAINECISDKFLYTVGPYLSDIRSIRNIVTEFYIQWKLLIVNQWSDIYVKDITKSKVPNKKEVDNFIITESQQLLALMIFKHFSPINFHLARQDKGLLNYIFNNGKEKLFKSVKSEEENIQDTSLSELVFRTTSVNESNIIFPIDLESQLRDFIRKMISYDYIDENYSTFLNYYIEGIFTLNDFKLCKRINNVKDYSINIVNEQIDNPRFILLKIKPKAYHSIGKKLFHKKLASAVVEIRHNYAEWNYYNYLNSKLKELDSSQKINTHVFDQISDPVYESLINILKISNFKDEIDVFNIFQLIEDEEYYNILKKIIKDSRTEKSCSKYIITESKSKNQLILKLRSHFETFLGYSDLNIKSHQINIFFACCIDNNLTLKDPIYQKKLEEYRLEYQEDKTTHLEDS